MEVMNQRFRENKFTNGALEVLYIGERIGLVFWDASCSLFCYIGVLFNCICICIIV